MRGTFSAFSIHDTAFWQGPIYADLMGEIPYTLYKGLFGIFLVMIATLCIRSKLAVIDHSQL